MAKKKTQQPRNRAAQDATLINLRALKKRVDLLERYIGDSLERHLGSATVELALLRQAARQHENHAVMVDSRLYALEQAARGKAARSQQHSGETISTREMLESVGINPDKRPRRRG